MVLAKLTNILANECLLVLEQPVIVGVSGGPDSMCLLDVLQCLGYLVLAAHLDHGLRPEAAQDAHHVQQVTEAMGVPFFLSQEDTPVFAAGNSLSIEEAARILRYRFLFKLAEAHGAQAVAVGHTADDQVETVLMHLLRGAGLAGLGGMEWRALPNAWSAHIPLVRPLLGLWREEVNAYCNARGLHPVMDRSNLDTTFYRNHLRHDVIPTLEKDHPRLRQTLLRTARVLRGDHQIVKQVVESAWQTCLVEQRPGVVGFDLASFNAQSRGIQRNLVRKAISLHRPGLRDINFEAIERVLLFVDAPPRSAQSDLAAGLRTLIEGNILWLAVWEANLPVDSWPALPKGQELILEVPGSGDLVGGWKLRAEVVCQEDTIRHQALENIDPYQAWMDAEGVQFPLLVRGRRAGDCLQPLGMEGQPVKVTDYMINHKLPRRARPEWPLVCNGQEVMWLPGYQLSHVYRLRETTQRVIYLRFSREEIPDSVS